MNERREISFLQLEKNCKWPFIRCKTGRFHCDWYANNEPECKSKNCPIWKTLKKP